jgi:hypothetical protein
MAANADRHLLFGLLALQNGIISQGQLVHAFQAWTLDKSKSLADHLESRGDLSGARRALLEALANVHLEAHEGDAEKSLAALPANRSIRASLAELGEPEIEATLARVARSKNRPVNESEDDRDPDCTTTYSVGKSTGDGQRFRILRPHARGGLGAVFVALDGELHREVALKQILDKHADDPVSRQRFVAEAEITGGLEHPGIVPVYGLGTDSFGHLEAVCLTAMANSLHDRYATPKALADDLDRWLADEMDLLRRAMADGYRDLAALARDTALDSLRKRPDFQLLMMDLTFPAEPFARGE